MNACQHVGQHYTIFVELHFKLILVCSINCFLLEYFKYSKLFKNLGRLTFCMESTAKTTFLILENDVPLMDMLESLQKLQRKQYVSHQCIMMQRQGHDYHQYNHRNVAKLMPTSLLLLLSIFFVLS